MSPPIQADSLRIAIAIAALRQKPAEQSYDAYVLDLRSKFVSGQTADEELVRVSHAWRDRALELERRLEHLQIKCDETRVELTLLRETRAPSEAPSETPATLAKQKKPKKKSGQTSSAPVEPPGPRSTADKITLGSVLGGGPNNHTPGLSKALGNAAALATLETLDSLISLRAADNEVFTRELLAATMDRALSALGAVLCSQLPPDLDHLTPQSISCLDALSTLVPRVLTNGLPLLVRGLRSRKAKASAKGDKDSSTAMMDATLGRLATAICLPLIRSLVPLARTSLAHLLDRTRSSGKGAKKRMGGAGTSKQAAALAGRTNATDAPAAALALLRAVMDALDALGAAVSRLGGLIYDLRCCLVLEALQELESVYAGAEADKRSAPASAAAAKASHEASGPRARTCPSAPERLQRLLRKDSLWYLCSVLHLVFLPAPALSARKDITPQTDLSNGARTVLEEAILTGLSDILHKTRRTHSQGGGSADMDDCMDGGGGGPACAVADGARARQTGAMTRGRGGGLRASVMGEVERGMALAVAERAWLGL